MLFASWLGAVINPQWLELPISRTNFYSPKDVRAIEVWLYLPFLVYPHYSFSCRLVHKFCFLVWVYNIADSLIDLFHNLSSSGTRVQILALVWFPRAACWWKGAPRILLLPSSLWNKLTLSMLGKNLKKISRWHFEIFFFIFIFFIFPRKQD